MLGFPLTPDAVRAWGPRVGLQLLVADDGQGLALMRPDDPRQLLRFLFRPERGLLTLALQLDVKVPEARLALVDRALCRANAEIWIGAWVLMHDHGEVFFRLSVPMGDGGTHTDAGLLALVQAVFTAVDRMGASIQRVALLE